MNNVNTTGRIVLWVYTKIWQFNESHNTMIRSDPKAPKHLRCALSGVFTVCAAGGNWQHGGAESMTAADRSDQLLVTSRPQWSGSGTPGHNGSGSPGHSGSWSPVRNGSGS